MRFYLSLAMLRDWKQERTQPDQTASTLWMRLIMQTLGAEDAPPVQRQP
jgi:hypothetical protein